MPSDVRWLGRSWEQYKVRNPKKIRIQLSGVIKSFLIENFWLNISQCEQKFQLSILCVWVGMTGMQRHSTRPQGAFWQRAYVLVKLSVSGWHIFVNHLGPGTKAWVSMLIFNGNNRQPNMTCFIIYALEIQYGETIDLGWRWRRCRRRDGQGASSRRVFRGRFRRRDTPLRQTFRSFDTLGFPVFVRCST